MAHYNFITVWDIDAPIEDVWEQLIHSEDWPQWWPAVQSVIELEKGDEQGIGNIREYHWKTPLSYALSFKTRLVRIEPPILIEGIASGEVEGKGIWELQSIPKGTRVHYYWIVVTTKLWMNLLALLLKPLMEWNHNATMKQGAQGLSQRMDTEVTCQEMADS
ncbi:SRPBCC family protein [Acaryochloris sp. CCMEE 5410]|uniref:SRPBCC family protein n=1 Tax=Acaryochloris sp. CCMEE 5410 TaxID=310037 RepID=UPI0002484EF9|nr:SRPBCC family protein [Acaryochloris sp. CCMEE 5410]KAI9129839.1 SRPBCC family protein [Acaryochloris sp. CCMEE 5410]